MDQEKGPWMENAFDILRLVKEAIVLVDDHRKVLFVNRRTEDMFGWTAERIVGESFGLFFMEDDIDILFDNIFRLTEHDGEFSGEVLLKDRKGRQVFCWLSASIYGKDGNRLFIFSIHDISDYKKIEKEYLESNRFARMGKIFAELAHHIRNPVVSIGGFSRLLQKSELNPVKRNKYLETIEEETARLERIVARITEFGHVPEPRYNWERIGTLLHSCESQASDTFRDSRLVFEPLEHPDVSEKGILTDKDLLLKSLMHLLENGLEALRDENGRVFVSMQVGKELLQVRIMDTGAGIGWSDQERIFDPFYSTKPLRVGLGLTIAMSGTREMGGTVEVHSKPGSGATFVLTCPLERRRPLRVQRLGKGQKDAKKRQVS